MTASLQFRVARRVNLLLIACFFSLLGFPCLFVRSVNAADRSFVQTIPLDDVGETQARPSNRVGNIVDRVCGPDAADGVSAWNVDGWRSYEQLWNEFSRDPNSTALRKYLGLPIGRSADRSVVMTSRRGRSAPNWLRWKAGSYRQVETPHFQIFSRADNSETSEVATDLERVYWAWTQLFFPLWESGAQVAAHFSQRTSGESVAGYLDERNLRLASRQKIRVVLLRDESEYARLMGGSTPGVQLSTGFYSDERRTSFFYPSESADAAATRRHEIVHQLFREATRSGLGNQAPGQRSEFWLVEGIAGYFESMNVDGTSASIGGWDSPRLQFARYRILGQRESMPLSDLRRDGQAAAQRRSDLTRWYAFSISHTHSLMDGPSIAHRRWVYEQLAQLYELELNVPDARLPRDAQRALNEFLKLDDDDLRANPTSRHLTELCLVGCEVTGDGLRQLVRTNESLMEKCHWLDLSRLPISTADVIAFCPSPKQITQLSLEATRIDPSIAAWLKKIDGLSELDLSWTACDDSVVSNLDSSRQLTTLWLTGSRVTDRSIPVLASIRSLESLDIQRTGVTAAGLADLKRKRPDCNINPLRFSDQ